MVLETPNGEIKRMQSSDTQFPNNPNNVSPNGVSPPVVPLGPSGNKWAVTAPTSPQSFVLYQRYGPIKAGTFLEFDYAVANFAYAGLVIGSTMSTGEDNQQVILPCSSTSCIDAYSLCFAASTISSRILQHNASRIFTSPELYICTVMARYACCDASWVCIL
jgi:hypothetical protein